MSDSEDEVHREGGENKLRLRRQQIFVDYDQKRQTYFVQCYRQWCLSLRRASVRLGELDERTDPDCYQFECADPVQDFYPSVVKVHSEYDKPKFRNDLALIRLDRPVNITSK